MIGVVASMQPLFDALYGETPRFARYVEEHAREGLHFVSVSLPNATPARESRVLLKRLRQRLGTDAVATAGPSDLAEVVAQQREQVVELEKQIASMEETIRELKG